MRRLQHMPAVIAVKMFSIETPPDFVMVPSLRTSSLENIATEPLTMHEFENPAVLRLKSFLDCSVDTGL